MTEPIDHAWAVLKQDEPMSDEEYLDNERQIEIDHNDSIFIEDFGEVPKEDYYNAEWWWNHPHGHINSVRDEFESIEHLQSQLDKERGTV